MNPPAREMSDRPNGHIGLKTSATLGDIWPDCRPQLEGIEMFDKQGLERQMKTARGQSGRLARWRAGLMAGTVLGGGGFWVVGGGGAGGGKKETPEEDGKDVLSRNEWE